MALKNTSEDKRVPFPEGSTTEADVIWIVPTQAYKHETIVQIILFREIQEISPAHTIIKKNEDGEDAPVQVEAVWEESDTRLEGYVPLLMGTPFNIGNAPTHMGLATHEQDLHDFAISVLGINFIKI